MMYTDLRAMMYSATSSAYVAYVMTCLILWEMLIIVPLFCGIITSLDKKSDRLLGFLSSVC